jgi:hypothetical protein
MSATAGPAPGLVLDWVTPDAFWGFLFCVALAGMAWWLVRVSAYPLQDVAPAPVVPAHPCAPHGHQYRAQPVTWRCVHCGDERTTDGVYDQEHAA